MTKKKAFKVYISWNDEESIEDMICGMDKYEGCYFQDWLNDVQVYKFENEREVSIFKDALNLCRKKFKLDTNGIAPCFVSEKEYLIMKKMIELFKLKGDID